MKSKLMEACKSESVNMNLEYTYLHTCMFLFKYSEDIETLITVDDSATYYCVVDDGLPDDASTRYFPYYTPLLI